MKLLLKSSYEEIGVFMKLIVHVAQFSGEIEKFMNLPRGENKDRRRT